jgi:Protein of unknown function (DUF1559)
LGTYEGGYQGPFTANSKTKITDIIDGSSNTLLFGETLAGTSVPGTQRDFALTWLGAGCMPTDWELCVPAQWYNFSSRHIGIVQFTFGDGSVRPITTYGNYNNSMWGSPRWLMFLAVSGMNDGIVLNNNLLGL